MSNKPMGNARIIKKRGYAEDCKCKRETGEGVEKCHYEYQ